MCKGGDAYRTRRHQITAFLPRITPLIIGSRNASDTCSGVADSPGRRRVRANELAQVPHPKMICTTLVNSKMLIRSSDPYLLPVQGKRFAPGSGVGLGAPHLLLITACSTNRLHATYIVPRCSQSSVLFCVSLASPCLPHLACTFVFLYQTNKMAQHPAHLPPPEISFQDRLDFRQDGMDSGAVAQSLPHRRKKKFILCFDGTGNKFSGTDADSNILKIYRMLDRNDDDQFHYYQPGIGTYVVTKSSSHTSRLDRLKSWYAKAKDSAVGAFFHRFPAEVIH